MLTILFVMPLNYETNLDAIRVGLFGSGWVWLADAPGSTLQITQEPSAGNPLTCDLKPILTFDIWEHAYYLDYQNRRPTHLTALWQLVDWEEIYRRFKE